MRSRTPILAAALSLLVLTQSAAALDLGDPAPALKISEWIKGDAVDLKKPKAKTVYVLEFWATWCGPCRVSIPHLTELQAKYKDKVVIIGISDEKPDVIKGFVEKMGSKMVYTVAADEDDSTFKTYLGGFGVQGIPHAFIVDKGRIVWSGSPMAGLDEALEQVVAGKFDLEAAKREAKAGRLLSTYFMALIQAEEEADAKAKDKLQKQAKKTGQEIYTLGQKSPQVLNALSWMILTEPKIKQRDLALALKAGKTAYELTKGKDPAVTDTYARALWDSGKKADAVKYQKEAVTVAKSLDENMAKALQQTLDEYEKALPKDAGTPKTRPARN